MPMLTSEILVLRRIITSYKDFEMAFPKMALRHFIKKPVTTEKLKVELEQKIHEEYEIIG